MPAPSPSTKPSRSASKGREAVAGSSLRSESALQEQKPPMPERFTQASAPPAIITSASPYSIMRPASPIAMGARGACRDHRHVRALGLELDRDQARHHVDDGAGHEERRDAPRPLGDHLADVVLDHRQPADARAHVHADALGVRVVDHEAGVVERHLRGREPVVDERVGAARLLRRASSRPALKPFTSAAMRVGSTEASNCVIGPTPLTPLRRLSQAWASRVTDGRDDAQPGDDDASLRHVGGGAWSAGRPRLLLDVRLDVVDGLLDVGDLLSLVVGDLALELFLERHHQLDVVEGIRAQVFDE